MNLQAWLALFNTAMILGRTVSDGVHALAAAQLTPDELAQLEAAWDEDVQRSAANAGIPPVPDTPLP